MGDPGTLTALLAGGVIALAMVSLAALRGFDGWLDLRRMEIRQSQRGAEPASPAAARLELADLKDRIRRLEAIANGIETILLAAPTAPDERLPRVVARARGFVYAVGLVGITGERDELAASATIIAGRLKAITGVVDTGLFIGIATRVIVGTPNGPQVLQRA